MYQSVEHFLTLWKYPLKALTEIQVLTIHLLDSLFCEVLKFYLYLVKNRSILEVSVLFSLYPCEYLWRACSNSVVRWGPTQSSVSQNNPDKELIWIAYIRLPGIAHSHRLETFHLALIKNPLNKWENQVHTVYSLEWQMTTYNRLLYSYLVQIWGKFHLHVHWRCLQFPGS